MTFDKGDEVSDERSLSRFMTAIIRLTGAATRRVILADDLGRRASSSRMGFVGGRVVVKWRWVWVWRDQGGRERQP